MSNTLLQQIKDLFKNQQNKPDILGLCDSETQDDYNRSRKVFNRKFDFMPPVIVKVKTTEQVSKLLTFANQNTVQFTVRSGGHDHEGESVATGKVLIDFSLMNRVYTDLPEIKSDSERRQVMIQSGARFESIAPALSDKGWSIPHGTCKTVAIAGYTMGGGWGPWTRLHGMGCEWLEGATIVLGDGEIRYLGTSADYNQATTDPQTKQANDQLLWALRGGGGLSYGVVTEFYFKPFELPKRSLSFVIKNCDFDILNSLKAKCVIKAWEDLIAPEHNPHLIGTNLKVNAQGVEKDDISSEAVLSWQFNGHFGGTIEELSDMLNRWGDSIKAMIDADKHYSADCKKQMKQEVQDAIDKFINNQSNHNIKHYDAATANSTVYPFDFESWDRYAAHNENDIELEPDCPAPHKITSRMPTLDWDDKSREQLVCSLQSPLLLSEKATSIAAYITLGAISGEFYGEKLKQPKSKQNPIAFPYQDRPFTIQYQAWWDQPTDKCCSLNAQEQKLVTPTRFEENRAQDWIATCRDFPINETKGAFISFKDASVATETYFDDNYDGLIKTKRSYSQDCQNLLRSRKTIL